MSADGTVHHEEPAAPASPAAAAPPFPGAKTERATRDTPLRTIKEADYLSLDPEIQQALSDRIDLYYGTPLDIFPASEHTRKPDRFHVLFARQIEERFPDDADLRGRIHDYGRDVFKGLLFYMLGKRGLQLAALLGLAWLATSGPAMFAQVATTPPLPLALTILAMLLVCGVVAGIGLIVFTQYRVQLENRSYELSREIVQRTRELQNLYTNIKAMPDQSETQFQMDGPAWGRRSGFLMRLLLWMGARLEYLEKYTQVEMWRVRRERYWMNWAGGILTVLVVTVWAAVFIALPPPAGADAGFRVLQGAAILLGFAQSLWSYFTLRTPPNIVREKLGSESWIRYASLDLDNAVGDQSRRDKERLVEYRSLTRGR
ncbi:MAG TPA: hypothetical protein VEA15_02400 [Caulobacteraceae bacterium]|nr:hypothetical protein [Caulobacteraceae bacterium]